MMYLLYYFIGVFIVGGLVDYIVNDNKNPAPVIFGMLWPIAVPIFLGCILIVWGMKAIGGLLRKVFG